MKLMLYALATVFALTTSVQASAESDQVQMLLDSAVDQKLLTDEQIEIIEPIVAEYRSEIEALIEQYMSEIDLLALSQTLLESGNLPDTDAVMEMIDTELEKLSEELQAEITETLEKQ